MSSFLKNDCDIILDAVLTDHGRKLLARGDGSFKITKFALADDEINYELYDKIHTSGSSYYDLSILQTPVLEAFANNASSFARVAVTCPTFSMDTPYKLVARWAANIASSYS